MLLALSAGGGAAAAPASPAPAPPAAAEDEAAKRRDTVKYGIDSEILELLKKLGEAKDPSLNGELAELLSRTRSPKLRAAVLDFFAAVEWKGVEAEAAKMIEDRDLLDPGTVSSALGYLAAIRSKKALHLAPKLLGEGDTKLLPSVIRLLGRAGGSAEEELLLGWFEGDEATEALRQEAIRALGEMGSAKAAERLGAIAKDPDKNMATRMAACEALGKIRAASSVPALIDAANGENPNVRAKAVEALASFEDEASANAIIEAMRDSFVKSRIAACKAAAARRLGSAAAFLRYKARSDPERAVRLEALRSLSAIGGESFAFLRERVDDAKAEPAVRALCFGLLACADAGGSMGVLRASLAAAAADKDRGLYTAYLRELANLTAAPLAAPLARVALADKDPLMRIAAVEWARRSKPADFKADLERLAAEDPAEMIRKRASAALEALREEE